MPKIKEVVLGVSASISIYKSCDILRRLKELDLSVSVILTPEAEELIRPIVFQSLSGNRVYCGLFDMSDTWNVGHIALAERADLLLIAPATANIIGKLACGICDDLLTCVACATTAPVLIAPAMNENMYRNRIVQENTKRLKSVGYKFVEPRKGRLACGKVGVGCLADVETIINEVKKFI